MHQTYPVHPLAEAFPLIEGPAFDELVASVREYGLREPITLCNGAVLDGRNRLRACEAAQVEPRFEEYTGDNPAAYVTDKNINRRHMDASQRSMVAAKLSNIPHGVNIRHQDIETSISLISVPQAAALLNVNSATVSAARTVLAKGTPEEIHQIETGEAAVTTVARQIRQGVTSEKRTPRKAKDQTQRQATHQMRGDIWHQFKTALVALTGMPHVEDAVGIIRSQDRNGFVAEKLPLAADYLKEFLDAWNSING